MLMRFTIRILLAILAMSGGGAQAQFGFPDFAELTKQMQLFNQNMGSFSGAVTDLTSSMETITGETIPNVLKGMEGVTEQIATTTEAFQSIASMYEPQVAAFNENAKAMTQQAAAFNGNFADLNKNLDNYYRFLQDPKALFKSSFALSAGAAAGAIVTGFVLNGVLHLVSNTIHQIMTGQRDKHKAAFQMTSRSLETIEKLVSFNYAFDGLKLYVNEKQENDAADDLLARISNEREEFKGKASGEKNEKKRKAYAQWAELLGKMESYITGIRSKAKLQRPLLLKRINDYKIAYFQVILSLTVSYEAAFSYMANENRALLKSVRREAGQIFAGMNSGDDQTWIERLKRKVSGVDQRSADQTIAYVKFEFQSLNSENKALIEEFLDMVWTDLHDEAELFYASEKGKSLKKPNGIFEFFRKAIATVQQKINALKR